MKKKLIAVGLSLVLTLSMSLTAMAASSSTSNNSGNQEETSSSPSAPATATPSNPKPVATVVAEKKAGENVQAAAVQVTIMSSDGTVSAVTLDKVVSNAQTTLASATTTSPAQKPV